MAGLAHAPMNHPTPTPPSRSHAEWMAGARALGASGGGAGAARVMALLYDPDVDIDKVLDCLRAEPGLAARVLKVANAPYYRQAGSVGTVDRAVQVLGLTAIRGVAASGCLDRLTPPRRGKAFDPERFRLHCLAVACAAQQLAAAAGCDIAGEAYMAGLLHDIGLLLMVKVDGAAMDSYAPPDTQDRAVARAAEAAHFGTTHEDCALLLTQSWSMPDWLAQAITSHHDEDFAALAQQRPQGLALLPALLALADHIADCAGFSLLPRGAMSEPAGAAACLGLDADAVQALVAALPAALAELQGS
jgi:HD-like signal output (HDOD) protein